MNQSFGGPWTRNKLEILRKYLSAYMKIFNRHQYLHPIYIDGFAGSGSIHVPERHSPADHHPDQQYFELEGLPAVSIPERIQYIEGSARLALSIDPPFAEYIFVERDPQHSKSLDGLKTEFPALANRITVQNADANTFLHEFLFTRDWKRDRAVLFLDPYGMEIEWSTIKSVAETEAIDLWLWFPIMAVHRHLTKKGPPEEDWANRVTRMLGTDSWKSEFYPTKKSLNLFDMEETSQRDADWLKISTFIEARLAEIFPGVAPPVIFKNSKEVPLFLFCFATGARKEKTRKAALRIANYLLKEK
jgi:three-Cys-motif partner protein